MKQKITLSNISNYIEGNTRMFTNSLQPDHIKEQLSYRMLLCKDDCAIQVSCIKCGCDYPGRLHTTKSCNAERFPDLMSKPLWDEFKKENNIE